MDLGGTKIEAALMADDGHLTLRRRPTPAGDYEATLALVVDLITELEAVHGTSCRVGVGHPGKVLLELLKKNDLGQHALVVSRVFGGVKLGVGGVSRAFREAGEGVIEEHSNQ